MNQLPPGLVVIMFIQTIIINFCAAQTNDQKSVFQSADANRDGKISFEEFKQHVKQSVFKNTDKDGDKKIDREEWKAAVPAPRSEVDFESIATNRDKTVDFLVFSRYADKNYNYDELFKELDRNRDGSLAPDEFNARPAFTIFSIKF